MIRSTIQRFGNIANPLSQKAEDRLQQLAKVAVSMAANYYGHTRCRQSLQGIDHFPPRFTAQVAEFEFAAGLCHSLDR